MYVQYSLIPTEIKEVLATAKIDPKEIAAVSTTCMREGIVLYDNDQKEIWACANVDARSNDEVGELIKQFPTLEKEIYVESGQTYALGALPRILWVKNKLPDIYDKTAYVSMFNDWLILKLTGKMTTEPSNGSTTGIFNLQSREWNPEIAKKCGLKDDIFPQVYESGTIVANINSTGAKETGLAEGTPVVAGGGDCQLGSIGVCVVEDNQAAILGGSFWQYEYNTNVGKTDDNARVRVNCHAIPDLWQFEALAFFPGLVMRWYRDAFCELEKLESKENGKDPYTIMAEKSAHVPAGCYGMMCSFSDVMNYIEWKHAAPTFTNFALDPEKYNRFTFFRSLMENACLVTKGHFDLVKEVTGKIPEKIVFASGASKSPQWCQMLSDVLGLPIQVPVVKEATALGAAILAGVGVGIYEDAATAAKKMVKWDNEYFPNPENTKIYAEMYQVWRQMYAAQLELADKGVTNHMWIAPGL